LLEFASIYLFSAFKFLEIMVFLAAERAVNTLLDVGALYDCGSGSAANKQRRNR